MKKPYLLLSVLFILFFLNITFAQDAVYKIEFISNWSSTTHPTDYPTASAHWSPLIGTTHKDATPFLQLGMLATDGVEQVAETGGTSIITQEINTIITSGNAYKIINGSGLNTGLGTITVNNVEVDGNFPFITLLTMIAPSPDWIAQVNNIKLTDGSDNWQTSISVDVYATDAGTDDGTTYSSANADTNPAENIRSLENTLPFSDEIVGTFIFTLQQVLAVHDNLLHELVSIYPNPNVGYININNMSSIILNKADIYNISGKKVRVFENIAGKKRIDFNGLENGVYFLKLNSDKGNIVKKLIIQ